MFSLWRKLELAENVYFRPLASYSNSLSSFNQIDVVKKDVIKTTSRDPEMLETVFKSATNPLQVLRKLPSNPSDFKTLPGETVIRALQTIALLQKANKDVINCQFITSHPNFEQLCRRLKRCSTMFTADELVKSFRFLCSLGVPTNSEISLVLLNLIRHQINELSVERIIYLDFILSQTECQSELQKVIQKSLPLVFELQVPQQIDKENQVSELVAILNYLASHKSIDTKSENTKRICKILCDKNEEINSADAINIIYHLCAIDRFHIPNSIKLITICIRRILDQIIDIDVGELQRIIDRLVGTTVNHFSPFQFHLHSLLNAFAERISQEDLGLRAALSLQKTIKNISFQSAPLLKYIGDQMVSNVNGCRTMSSLEIFTIIQAFANNSFTPESDDDDGKLWMDQILPEILANENLARIDQSSRVWLPFTLQLVVLGHFDQQLISRVLSESYLKTYLERKDLDTLDLYKILILYQTVAMQNQTNTTSIQTQAIQDICRRYAEQMPSCDIQLDLIDHYGKSCVLINVRTKFMHLIPTLVKINKDTGHFERFSDDIPRDQNGFILLENVACPENEVLVCVDSIKRYHLFSNVTVRNHPLSVNSISDDTKIGTFRLRPKQLEQMGLSVCEINYRRYKNLRLGNKAKYLQENIIKCATQMDSTLD